MGNFPSPSKTPPGGISKAGSPLPSARETNQTNKLTKQNNQTIMSSLLKIPYSRYARFNTGGSESEGSPYFNSMDYKEFPQIKESPHKATNNSRYSSHPTENDNISKQNRRESSDSLQMKPAPRERTYTFASENNALPVGMPIPKLNIEISTEQEPEEKVTVFPALEEDSPKNVRGVLWNQNASSIDEEQSNSLGSKSPYNSKSINNRYQKNAELTDSNERPIPPIRIEENLSLSEETKWLESKPDQRLNTLSEVSSVKQLEPDRPSLESEPFQIPSSTHQKKAFVFPKLKKAETADDPAKPSSTKNNKSDPGFELNSKSEKTLSDLGSPPILKPISSINLRVSQESFNTDSEGDVYEDHELPKGVILAEMTKKAQDTEHEKINEQAKADFKFKFEEIETFNPSQSEAKNMEDKVFDSPSN